MAEAEPEIGQRLELARTAAERAGELILSHYQSRDLTVELKGDQSPVTIADREAEQLIRRMVADAFPDDAVFGEEFGETEGTSGYRWILDPIDGTKSFVHGVPLFGTLIGIEHEGVCKIGVCRIPAMNEVVYAARGQGAWWQQGTGEPTRAAVTQTAEPEQALFCYTAVDLFERAAMLGVYEALRHRSRISRGWGDCYGHVLVATGRADFIVEPLLNAWDIAALVPIIEEAGGACIDWNGETNIHTGNGISVNANLRDAVLTIINEHRT